MANPMRGWVDLVIDGQPGVARLSLGALAELEQALATPSLMDLAERFETGRFSSRDVMAVLVAGLRGGGWAGQIADLMVADKEGGPVGAAQTVANLLALAFRRPA
ncbi:MAG: gene transfer agent family protein [Paracoccus sp. (in: a-proteobacteria)]